MVLNEAALPPLVIDLGKRRRKPLKQLERGHGKLLSQVQEVVERVRTELGAQAHGKEFVPVVIVFQRKRSRRGALGLPCGF